MEEGGLSGGGRGWSVHYPTLCGSVEDEAVGLVICGATLVSLHGVTS